MLTRRHFLATAGFSSQTETEPVGGHGLVPAADARGA
jgi:hypothetical protein